MHAAQLKLVCVRPYFDCWHGVKAAGTPSHLILADLMWTSEGLLAEIIDGTQRPIDTYFNLAPHIAASLFQGQVPNILHDES